MEQGSRGTVYTHTHTHKWPLVGLGNNQLRVQIVGRCVASGDWRALRIPPPQPALPQIPRPAVKHTCLLRLKNSRLMHTGMPPLIDQQRTRVCLLPRIQPLSQPEMDKLLIRELFHYQIREGSVACAAHGSEQLGPVFRLGPTKEKRRDAWGVYFSSG